MINWANIFKDHQMNRILCKTDEFIQNKSFCEMDNHIVVKSSTLENNWIVLYNMIILSHQQYNWLILKYPDISFLTYSSVIPMAFRSSFTDSPIQMTFYLKKIQNRSTHYWLRMTIHVALNCITLLKQKSHPMQTLYFVLKIIIS